MYHIGDRFDRLVVLGLSRRTPQKYFVWCQCDCGNVKEFCTSDLVSGRVHSCGCFAKEILVKRGENKIKEKKLHEVFLSIKQRCNNPRSKSYKNYGGRGIKVCDEWGDRKFGYRRFEKWALGNGYREGLSIDRIDNDKGYSPENCRWADWKTQSNNKRTNRVFDVDGAEMTLKQISESFGVPYDLLRLRIKRGWEIKTAITVPKQKSKYWKS